VYRGFLKKELASEIVFDQRRDELEGDKLDGVNLQSVPADEAQHTGYYFWRLHAGRTAPEKAESQGQNAQNENEDGEL
jgi:hypothetical protein